MDIGLFFGRFHPILVHLPIGFLLLAAILEGISILKMESKFNEAIKIILLLGVLAAALSIISGLSLSSSGGYQGTVLNLHKWMGISVGVISIVSLLLKADILTFPTNVYRYSVLALVLIITATGHFGGELTHGEGYLVKYAPQFVQNIFGVSDANKTITLPEQPDSLIVFEHLIKPLLESKCNSCHNENKLKGGLNLTSKELIIEGGENGDVISSGDVYESEIFKRVILPSTSKKAMPPGGPSLTYNEASLLAWWIKSGASFEVPITEHEIPENIINILNTDFNYDPRSRPYWETAKVQSIERSILDSLKSVGFKVNILGENNNFLDVGVGPQIDSLTEKHMNLLTKGADHITWLNLSNSKITDELVSILGSFDHLTRLDLNSNPISETALTNLENLDHLESINIYNTKVGDSGLESLKKIYSLKRIYLWQSDITEEGIQKLKDSNPDLEVVGGFQTSGSM